MHNTDGQKACIYLSTHSFEPQIVPVQGEDIMDTVRKMIGCEWVEVVHPRRLSEQYAVLVDEEGLLKASPVFNEIASYLYEIEQHGQPIVGDAVIVRVVYDPEIGAGLEWLSPEEAEILANNIRVGLKQFILRLRRRERA